MANDAAAFSVNVESINHIIDQHSALQTENICKIISTILSNNML